MGVVKYEQLHRYMSEPKWSSAQQQTAREILIGVQADLEAALFGAVIEPRVTMETAHIAAPPRPGPATLQVMTSLPVLRVLVLDGVVLGDITADPAEDAPLPAEYELRSHRLYLHSDGPLAGLRHGWPWVAPALGPGSAGAVPLRYVGGWGAEPALVDAILRKASARMNNRHSNVMGVSGVTAAVPPKATSRTEENFTDADLRSLGRFRNLGWGRE